ncbi:CCT motif family protein [Trifolium repens]|nr:CCT motif family protein [Trifolium repens]
MASSHEILSIHHRESSLSPPYGAALFRGFTLLLFVYYCQLAAGRWYHNRVWTVLWLLSRISNSVRFGFGVKGIEESSIDVDPMTAAISMISCGEDVKSADISILQNEQLLSNVFYDCKKDLFEKTAMESPLSEILEIKVPLLSIDENTIQENKQLPDITLPKSVSSGCLSSMDWMHGSASMKPAFIGVSEIDFDAVYGMRRSFSEGDIKHVVERAIELRAELKNAASDDSIERAIALRKTVSAIA